MHKCLSAASERAWQLLQTGFEQLLRYLIVHSHSLFKQDTVIQTLRGRRYLYNAGSMTIAHTAAAVQGKLVLQVAVV